MTGPKPSPNSSRIIYADAERSPRRQREAHDAAIELDGETQATLRAAAFGRAHAAMALSTMDLADMLVSESFVFLEKGSVENEWRIAVIIAHAACDVETGRTLEELARRAALKTGEAPETFSRTVAFSQKKTLAAYRRLSGDDLKKASWWSEWDASVDRRNDVAHRGARVTRKQASASYEACRLMVAHLKQQLRRD